MEDLNIVDVDFELPICKYMPFTYFCDLVSSSKLYFRATHLYDDLLEGTDTATGERVMDNMLSEFIPEHEKEAMDSLKSALKEWSEIDRRYVYVSCWTQHQEEQEWMWKKYACKGNGVLLKTTLGKILESILNRSEGLVVGPVRYVDHNSSSVDTVGGKAKKKIFLKNLKYDIENEIRFVTRTIHKRACSQESRFMKVKLEGLFKEIVLGCNLSEADKDFVISKFKTAIPISSSKILIES